MPLSSGQVSASPVLQMVKVRHKEVKELAQGCAVSGDRSGIRAASSWLAEALLGRAAQHRVPSLLLCQTENLVSISRGKALVFSAQ